MADFSQLTDLASSRLGGVVLYANDEFFAPRENLLKESKPVFIEGRDTDRGKWMDGWETRRRRTPGHDFCIVKLALAGVVRGIVVDTSFFRGDFPEACSLEGCVADPASEPAYLASAAVEWVEILPKAPLRGDAQNHFSVVEARRFTHVRFNIFPDGGIARLHIFGEVIPEPSAFAYEDVDIAAVEHGGRVVSSNDAFFGRPEKMLYPGRGTQMGDGWETRRRRGPGHDWAVIALGCAGTIWRVEVDTAHFKGNAPDSCRLDSCDGDGNITEEILPSTKLLADNRHLFVVELKPHKVTSHVRFSIFPDGGVSRLRLFATPSREARELIGLRYINSLTGAAAEELFRRACGSAALARRMKESRPFASLVQLQDRAAQASKELAAKVDISQEDRAAAGEPFKLTAQRMELLVLGESDATAEVRTQPLVDGLPQTMPR